MGNGDGNTAPPVKSYPPPRPMLLLPRVLNLVTAAAAATAGFLGFSEVAGILALLSLTFGFWDLFQTRDLHRQTYDPGSYVSTGGGSDGRPGGSGRPDTGQPDAPRLTT